MQSIEALSSLSCFSRTRRLREEIWTFSNPLEWWIFPSLQSLFSLDYGFPLQQIKFMNSKFLIERKSSSGWRRKESETKGCTLKISGYHCIHTSTNSSFYLFQYLTCHCWTTTKQQLRQLFTQIKPQQE